MTPYRQRDQSIRRRTGRGYTGRIAVTAVLLVLFWAGLAGCAAGGGASPQADQQASSPAPGQTAGRDEKQEVTLWVTRDFGRQVMHEANVPLKKGDSVMDLLKQVANVETAYGGGFVNSIDGLASGYTGKKASERSKQDWFYTVNGAPAQVGALDYQPQAGDIIWWDYHTWQSGSAGAYAVGAWPANLKAWTTNAKDRKVRISTSDAIIEQNIRRKLLKGSGVTGEEWQNNPAEFSPDGTFTIVAAAWDEVKGSSFFQDLNTHAARAGLPFQWSASGLEVLDEQGGVARSIASAGVIAAVDSGQGAPVMLVLATDKDALARTVDVLTAPDRWRRTYAVLVSGEEVVPLPLQAKGQDR